MGHTRTLPDLVESHNSFGHYGIDIMVYLVEVGLVLEDQRVALRRALQRAHIPAVENRY